MERLTATNEIAFKISFTGHSGHLRLHPLPPVESPDPCKYLPDLILPPTFVEESAESLKEYVEENYLATELDGEEFSVDKDARVWEFDWFEKAKVPIEPSAPRTVVAPLWELPFRRRRNEGGNGLWNPNSVEIDVEELIEGALESGSAARLPGPAKDFVRGSTNSRPFRPGGIDGSQTPERNIPEGALNGEWVRELIDGGPAQHVLPIIKKGLELGHLKGHPYSWVCTKEQRCVDDCGTKEKLGALSVQFDDLFKRAWEEELSEVSVSNSLETKIEDDDQTPIDDFEDEKANEEVSISNPVIETMADDLVFDVVEYTKHGEQGSDNTNRKVEKEAWALTGGSEEIINHFHELVPDMAINYPFELDGFQKEAIYYLEKGDSVFVAAHTSAGKTVVAEYAFALATKHCTRAVYTAPIKTISNQKYRDFSGKFDVGLLTGDVSLRPEASCLIMTTEILRSMLYRGADIIRDIEWVIFDEVHYVNDAERGVVWEEVIIMLPRHVNIVLLSATVPNALEFADWIGRTRKKKIRLTWTMKRPVPLEHCLFYSGEMYKVCEKETFLPQGLKAAKEAYKRKKSNTAGGKSGMKLGAPVTHASAQAKRPDGSGRGKTQKHLVNQNSHHVPGAGGSNQNNWGSRRSETSFVMLLINRLSKDHLLPVVIFCFSKNRCDKSADDMASTDLTSSYEKSEIRIFCDKAFSRLKGSDRNLPQVLRVQNLLRRGIGVHHAGLLPIVKEVVEMLFCRGVIKVLFSTETFAMGVNAPARTVVFDALRKFDGKDFRQLLPGEYIQMAGRAGRRGLDNTGTVIVMCRDEILEESDLKHVMVGKPTRLESQFRLTYTMILHLLRVEELKVEDMLKRSFAEFHAQKNLPAKEQLLLQKLRQIKKNIECIKGEPAIEEYYEILVEVESLREQMLEAIMQSNSKQFLVPGRVVVVKSQSVEDHILGVILKSPSTSNKQYIVLLLGMDASLANQASSTSLNKLPDKASGNFEQGYFINPKGKRGMDDDYFSSLGPRKGSGVINIKLPYHGTAAGMQFQVLEIDNKEIVTICDAKIKIDQAGVLEEQSNSAFSKTVQQLLGTRSEGGKFPPALDPLKDLKLKDMDIVDKYYKYNNLLQKMSANKCHGCVKLREHLMVMKEQKSHEEEVNVLKYQISDEALQQMPDFQGRIDVLKELQCIDSDLVVQLKGRVACEMNSGEELICTECLFENQLDDLEPEEAVAIMSALVFQQTNTSEPTLTPKLAHAKKRLYDTAIRLGKLQAQCNVSVDPEEYARENLKFGLVEVVYEWAKGTAFADICELTDVPEGLIVRTIVRLDETCREFKNAASIMGNSALHKKMETASNAIKRDIVFAASLYVTGV